MNKIEAAPQEWKPDAVGVVILCLLHSFLMCVGFSLMGMVFSTLILFFKSQYALREVIAVAIALSFFGSLFGFWFPALLYWVSLGNKWVQMVGAGCVGLGNSFLLPEMLNAIRSAG